MRNTILSLPLLLSVFIFTSCDSNKPMYLNSKEGVTEIQKKIEKLSAGNQIDSVSIRSTLRNSMLSSIYIITTDEKDTGENKKLVEYIYDPQFELREDSKIKRDALHAYKFNLSTAFDLVEKVKTMLPANMKYVDVHGLRYAASPFGEKFYIALEVDSNEDLSKDEYVETFQSQGHYSVNKPDVALTTDVVDSYYVVTFSVEGSNIQMLKSSN